MIYIWLLLKKMCIHFGPEKVGYHFHRRFDFHPSRNKFQEQPGVKPWKHWTISVKSCGQICRQWRPLRQFHSIEPRQPKMQPQLLNGKYLIRFTQPFVMILVFPSKIFDGKFHIFWESLKIMMKSLHVWQLTLLSK